MKKSILLFIAVFLTIAITKGQQPARFLTAPNLSPDAKTVVFTFENDLWKADLQTATATRLTAMQGIEDRAHFSPDGQWIAFTGTQYGNADVFLMPANGGEIKQLTYQSSYDHVEGWSWDSKKIYFKNGSQNGGTTFTIAVNGGTPARLFDGYFNRIHSTCESPTGEIFFNDTWESDNQAYRKRYIGAFNPDVQSYNPKNKSYKQYTDYAGKDMWATIDAKGKIYFVSDESTGEYNLFSFEKGIKKPLTQFKTSIKRPKVSANGQKIVFEKDYQLYIYDVASGQSAVFVPNLARNYTLPKAQDFNTKSNLTNADVATDGKKIAFSSRGELFVSDIEGKYIQQISTRADGRVQEVKWLADSKTLIFNQTVDGFSNWFTITADGKGAEKQLTTDHQNNRSITLNKDRSKAAYFSGRNEVRTMDLKTFESKTIAKEELWGFYNETPCFSPNDEYLMLTAYRDFERDILLVKLADNQIINLSNSGITESEPCWSPDGKYVYFVSDRLKPNYPFGGQATHVYRMALSKIDAPYRSDKFADLWKKEEKKDDKTAKTDTSKKAEVPKIEPIKIDAEGLMDRLELVGPSVGSQQNPFVIQKDNKTTVLYVSDHDQGNNALWKTVYEPFQVPKTEKIEGNISNFDVILADGKYYLFNGSDLKKVNLDGNKLENIDLSFVFRRNLADEFNQMFYETWAGLDENFYNENFHGIDWKKYKDQYAQYLPYFNSRDDFRVLMQDMLGELNSSHTGLSSGGAEESVFYKNTTLNTGILFDNDNPYKVLRVIKRSVADKEGKDILPGDILKTVNGIAIDPNMNRDWYFTKPSLDTEIELGLERNGKLTTVKIHPQSTGATNANLYDEWIDRNQKRVDELSKKRVAYVHLKDMGMNEYEKFVIDMTRDFYKKDALVVDLRYNTGGNVHDLVLNFLTQKSYLQWKYREGKLTNQPNFAPADKPIILLINEQSLSDAEMTATGFKTLKLGKIIGTETYRWIIFTSGKGLVDGSFYRLPSWGCYTLDGQNIEKEGVKPDIYVRQTFVDRIKDQDPQIEKAIEEILKTLK